MASAADTLPLCYCTVIYLRLLVNSGSFFSALANKKVGRIRRHRRYMHSTTTWTGCKRPITQAIVVQSGSGRGCVHCALQRSGGNTIFFSLGLATEMSFDRAVSERRCCSPSRSSVRPSLKDCRCYLHYQVIDSFMLSGPPPLREDAKRRESKQTKQPAKNGALDAR